MSTVILTGANGFVGRAFLRVAASGVPHAVLPVGRDRAVEALRQVAGESPDRPPAVLNLAWPGMHAYSSTRRSVASETSEWDRYKSWIAELAAATASIPGTRFFGIGSGVEPYALGCSPVLKEPYVTYARHKSEVRAILTGTPGLRVVWLRLHFMFGPHEAPTRLIPSMLRACRDGAPVEMGALERRRHWLHVDDAARGLAQAIASCASQDWDITGEHAVSFQDIIKLVEAVIERPVVLRPTKGPTADECCPHIAPTHLPRFMRGPVGSPAALMNGLKRYMIWIDQQCEMIDG